MNVHQKRTIEPGILSEVLKTPVCKDQLRSWLNTGNPASGRSLIRTLMWQDPEVFLSLVSALPSLLDALVDACAEMGAQLREKFPPELLSRFTLSIASQIDTARLKECSNIWGELLGDLWTASPDQRERLRAFVVETGPKTLGQGINALARGLNALEASHPGIVSTFFRDLLDGLDRDEIGKATHTLADALLDQKWRLGSWMLELAGRRIRRRFGCRRHQVDIRRWECS